MKSIYDGRNLVKEDFTDNSIDEGFKFLSILNTNYMGQTIYTGPLSKINDGMNDIICVKSSATRKQLFNMMLASDSGEKLFMKSKNKAKHGLVDPSLGMQYYKVNEWELKPERKGPVPADSNHQNPSGTVVHRREQFSIDGEKYPA